MRGKDNQHAHTAAMGARRMLTQSLAAELGFYVVISPFPQIFH